MAHVNRFKDGATIRLGPIELTAHITAGHSPGCTSWSFPIRDRDRELLAVHICGLQPRPSYHWAILRGSGPTSTAASVRCGAGPPTFS